jgi:hypothetical protein
MDNEASKAIKELLVEEFGLDYQLVPPHIHRRNAAKRAILTFKNNFIAGLGSANPTFPLRLWDRLLPQAEITLNLLRVARSNPTVSVYEAINGPFDYNKTPLAPPGIKVIIHEKPSQCKTWDPHGVLGWYLGPAEEHYRCYWCYVTNTHGERITDTLGFSPMLAKTPLLSKEEAAIAAADAPTEALQSTTVPQNLIKLLELGKAAIQRLNNIFQKKFELATTENPIPRQSPLSNQLHKMTTLLCRGLRAFVRVRGSIFK